jgi:TPR repeat protein
MSVRSRGNIAYLTGTYPTEIVKNKNNSKCIKMYLRLVVVAKDYSEPLKWYRKAAQQGNVTAQNNLGVMYNLAWTCLNGVGAPQSILPINSGSTIRYLLPIFFLPEIQ